MFEEVQLPPGFDRETVTDRNPGTALAQARARIEERCARGPGAAWTEVGFVTVCSWEMPEDQRYTVTVVGRYDLAPDRPHEGKANHVAVGGVE